MNSLKKVVSFSLLVILGLSVFSGCRTKDPVEGPKLYTGVELTYYKVFDGSDVIDPLIGKFIVKHPGLTIHYRMFSDFDEYQKTILNEMAEGEGPDIFSMQNTWFPMNMGKISPMPDDLGTSSDFEATFVDVTYEDLVHVDDDGVEKVFGMPMTVDTLALYYNKEHFEDRLPERGRPSVTWDGIKEDVQYLSKVSDSELDGFDVSGIAMGRAENISRGVDTYYLLLLQHGVEFYNEEISKAIFATLQGNFRSYPALDALELLVSFTDEDAPNYSWNEYTVDRDSDEKEIDAFARGDVSMMIGYSYMYEEIENRISVVKSWGQDTIDKKAIRVAPIPQLFDPDVSGKKRVTYANYFAETVSRNTEHPEIAWEFLLHMASKDSLEHYFDETNKPTSRRDMIDEQKDDPYYGVFVSQIGYAESFPIADYYIYKDLFTDVIRKASESGVSQSGIGNAQSVITEMLPLEGYVNERKAVGEDEE